MNRFIKYIFASVMGVLAAGFVGGCSADLLNAPDAPGQYDADTQLVLNLALPESVGTRAESSPEQQERKVNSLRLFAFSETGAMSTFSLQLPSEMPVSPDGTIPYQIQGLNPDKYKLYVVANVDDKVANVHSEAELAEVILNYGSDFPVASNLPMIYEPTSFTEIRASGQSDPVQLTFALRYACVKVRCNVIFDKEANPETQSVFGDAGLKLDKVELLRVSKSQYLVKNTDKLFDGVTASVAGKFYDTYVERQENANVNNADVLTCTGSANNTPGSVMRKWVYQTTLYLPERYAKSKSEMTTLAIDGEIVNPAAKHGAVKCRYEIPFGGYDGSDATENATELPRNTYYEIIAKVKSLGEATLDTKIVASDWMARNINADFVHTFLSLSKTSASVSSLEDDVLTYNTDGIGDPEVVCTRTLPMANPDGVPAVEFVHDPASKSIRVTVNPNVDILALPENEWKGEADCYIKAGNIKKYFKVKYDIAPFFIIEPTDLKIEYSRTSSAMNVREFEYRTNLGGILVTEDGQISSELLRQGKTSFTHTAGSSKITVSCGNPASAVGKLQVIASEPTTTGTHYFDAYPAKYKDAKVTDKILNAMSNRGKEDLSVTVLPPSNDYRIYFRAINDYHWGTGGKNTTEFLSGNNYVFPTEGVYNWMDFWGNSNSNTPDVNHHHIYIYTQWGETNTTELTQAVWGFTQRYGNINNQDYTGDSMVADSYNAGWYYYDLGVSKSPVFTDRVNTAPAAQQQYFNIPRPGETLLMFVSTNDVGQGYTVHRMPHHLDPGVPLFDFEDREGYVLFDPTAEPYFSTFDEKPQIEDVTYTIRSSRPMLGWYRIYGNASNSVPSQADRYTIYSNQRQNRQITAGGKTWYENTITLKCPKGKYGKAIMVKFGTAGSVSTTKTPHRVYLGTYGSNWGTPPRVYFFKDTGGEAWSWNNSPNMIKLQDNVYYYDVPSGYENAKVIFMSNDKSQQMPGKNDGGKQLSSTVNYIFYLNNWNYWEAYGDAPGISTSTGNDNVEAESMLFNGRTFTNNTGYFNVSSKSWSASPN